MREILFRGKPKNKGDYYFFSQTWKDSCRDGFVYGSLVVNKNRDLGDRYYICVTALCSINSCVNNGMTSMIEVIPETIGECTTLNDKNGRMIFEGDIISIPFEEDRSSWEENCTYYEDGEIYFDSEHYGWYVRFLDNDELSLWKYDELDIVVIGNIHD